MVLKSTSVGGVRVYNVSAGKSLPQWISDKKRRELLKEDVELRSRCATRLGRHCCVPLPDKILLAPLFGWHAVSNCSKTSSFPWPRSAFRSRRMAST
jgi:hypothetical protein